MLSKLFTVCWSLLLLLSLGCVCVVVVVVVYSGSGVVGQQCEIINQIVLVYDDGNRSDEDNDLDFMELEGSSGPHFRGHGHSHKMPQVEMVAPATTQEEQQKDEKKRKCYLYHYLLSFACGTGHCMTASGLAQVTSGRFEKKE